MTDPTTLSAGDGFTQEMIYLYKRSPGDPDGNATIHVCPYCHRWRENDRGHDETCPHFTGNIGRTPEWREKAGNL